MTGPDMRINIDLTDEEKVRRDAEWFSELVKLIRENPPPMSIDPTLIEEIRRGAETFERALELARFIRQHEPGGLQDLTLERMAMYIRMMDQARKER